MSFSSTSMPATSWNCMADTTLSPHASLSFSKECNSYPPRDFGPPVQFAEWFSQKQEVEGNFSERDLFTDEAHFNGDGTFNTHNIHHWDANNPHGTHHHSHQYRFSAGKNCGQQINWSVSNAFSSRVQDISERCSVLVVRGCSFRYPPNNVVSTRFGTCALLRYRVSVVERSAPKQVVRPQRPRRVAWSLTRHDVIGFLLVWRDGGIGV